MEPEVVTRSVNAGSDQAELRSVSATLSLKRMEPPPTDGWNGRLIFYRDETLSLMRARIDQGRSPAEADQYGVGFHEVVQHTLGINPETIGFPMPSDLEARDTRARCLGHYLGELFPGTSEMDFQALLSSALADRYPKLRVGSIELRFSGAWELNGREIVGYFW